MMRTGVIGVLLAGALAITGVASADPWKDESGHGRGHDRADRFENRFENRFEERFEDLRGQVTADRWGDEGPGRFHWPDEWRPGARIPPFEPPRLGLSEIPPGHLPPPGDCRTWIRGVPPGHQPPPYRC